MAELKNIVSQLKSAAKELLGQVSDIDAKIAELGRQRDALTGGVVSKDDFWATYAPTSSARGLVSSVAF